jgi:hypothetical protein
LLLITVTPAQDYDADTDPTRIDGSDRSGFLIAQTASLYLALAPGNYCVLQLNSNSKVCVLSPSIGRGF